MRKSYAFSFTLVAPVGLSMTIAGAYSHDLWVFACGLFVMFTNFSIESKDAP